MFADIEKVLIQRQEIARRVAEVARQITCDHQAQALGGDGEQPQLLLVPVLTGSIIFVADLIRELPLYLRMRMISVSSYPGASTQSRGALLRSDLGQLPDSLAGTHVLVIDDILDSGSTLKLVVEMLRQRQPASLRTCVLLRKRRPRALECPVDYVCFEIPDCFVAGYGLDFNDLYRNLPDIVTLRPEVLTAAGVEPEKR